MVTPLGTIDDYVEIQERVEDISKLINNSIKSLGKVGIEAKNIKKTFLDSSLAYNNLVKLNSDLNNGIAKTKTIQKSIDDLMAKNLYLKIQYKKAVAEGNNNLAGYIQGLEDANDLTLIELELLKDQNEEIDKKLGKWGNVVGVLS